MSELSVNHLLGIKYLNSQDIQLIFETADHFKEVINRPIKKVPSLRDITIANLFFENCRRDWFTTLGLNTYFLQTNDGQIQHFVVSQADIQYRKAIFLDEVISVRIDKVELKPASIIFYQSIHRHLPENDMVKNDNAVNHKPADTLLSSAKIVIACVQNQTKSSEPAKQSDNNASSAANAAPIRPIRVPPLLHNSIQHAISQQLTEQ